MNQTPAAGRAATWARLSIASSLLMQMSKILDLHQIRPIGFPQVRRTKRLGAASAADGIGVPSGAPQFQDSDSPSTSRVTAANH
jgi:hypothetical protein